MHIERTFTLEEGDSLEKECCQKIRQLLPAYEKIWSVFIGNNGQNQMVELKNFPEELYKYRKEFSEYHYTIIESILCIDSIHSEVQNMKLVRSIEDLLKIQNSILAFQAHIGRTIDNMRLLVYNILRINGKCKEDLDRTSIEHDTKIIKHYLSKLEEFYYQRHIWIHGKKVPMTLDKKMDIIIPILRKSKNSREGWDKTLHWEDMNSNEQVPLDEYISEIKTNFTNHIEDILQSIHNEICNYLKENKIVCAHIEVKSEKLVEPINVYNIDPSAVCSYYGISGSSTLPFNDKP
jgi:hypothetical protein